MSSKLFNFTKGQRAVCSAVGHVFEQEKKFDLILSFFQIFFAEIEF